MIFHDFFMVMFKFLTYFQMHSNTVLYYQQLDPILLLNINVLYQRYLCSNPFPLHILIISFSVTFRESGTFTLIVIHIRHMLILCRVERLMPHIQWFVICYTQDKWVPQLRGTRLLKEILYAQYKVSMKRVHVLNIYN